MDTTIMPYRLKTARRKRQLLKTDRDKQLLNMERELERLEAIKHELPLVALEEPYQKGWKRLWVLRPETAKSSKACFYQSILDKITEVQYHYDQSFKQQKRKKRWHKYYFERLPRLRVIDNYAWGERWLGLTDEELKCFREVKYWDEKTYRWKIYYSFAEPELFEIDIRAHIVDKIKLKDEVLEQQIDFIDDKLYRMPNWGRIISLNGGQYKNWYSKYFPEKEKYKNPLKNKPKYLWAEE